MSSRESANVQPEVRTGLASAFSDEEFSIARAIGGWRGVAESVLPTLLFLVVFIVVRDVVSASIVALVSVALCLGVRLIQRQSITPALGGALGVVLGAIVAIRSGDGTGFYAPGLIINAVYAVALLGCVLARFPLVGHVAAALDARVKGFGEYPFARRAYRRATLAYALLFAAKVAVQVPLYFANWVDALGIAKLAMGLPAFALVTFVIYVLHRSVVARISEEAGA